MANGTCGDTITATLHLQDGAIDLGNVSYLFRLGGPVGTMQTFSSATPITIPATGTGAATGAPAAPYPSTINVSGAPQQSPRVILTDQELQSYIPGRCRSFAGLADWAQDDRFVRCSAARPPRQILTSRSTTMQLQVAPDDIGLCLRLRSSHRTILPPRISSRRPPHLGPYLTPQTGGSDTLTSAFTGVDGGNPNGTWSLYVIDDAHMESGNINGGWEITLINSTHACAQAVTAVSRKMHGGVPFDIPLPLVGAKGIECRAGQGGGGTDHQMVVTFATPVTLGSAAVTSGTGSVVGTRLSPPTSLRST